MPEEQQISHGQVDAVHERWIAEIEQDWAPLFEACPDAVYVYIDDEHKTCSPRLADLFGMTVQHFKEMESFLDECVDEDSIDLVMHTYMKHFEEETKPVQFEFVARHSSGSTFPVTCFQVPIVHGGELMVLGFVRPAA